MVKSNPITPQHSIDMMSTLKIDQASDEVEMEDQYAEYGKAYEDQLPSIDDWATARIVQYQGFWLISEHYGIKAVKFLEDHFKPQPNDIILSSFPKSGTTWLRALIFSIVNRAQFDFSSHPLLTTNPHDCFPFLDGYISEKNPDIYDQKTISQRLFATHFPYSLLPDFIKQRSSSSSSKIVHVCRNPRDVFVSLFHYLQNLRPKDLPPLQLERVFDLFCNGTCPYGPHWDHVLEYWKASLEFPENVLFLKYEDLKKEPSAYVKRLAEFFDKPFSAEEEEEKVVEEIVKMCSFENLSKLKVNLSMESRETEVVPLRNKFFFRKGEVGDWVHHLTPEMVERLDRITEEKFKDSGLKF